MQHGPARAHRVPPRPSLRPHHAQLGPRLRTLPGQPGRVPPEPHPLVRPEPPVGGTDDDAPDRAREPPPRPRGPGVLRQDEGGGEGAPGDRDVPAEERREEVAARPPRGGGLGESSKERVHTPGHGYGNLDPDLPAHEAWLRKQASYKFAISPPGNGIDCHRTWEMILVGVVPVVRRSEIDSVFGRLADDGAVLLVDGWDEVDEALLEGHWARFGEGRSAGPTPRGSAGSTTRPWDGTGRT
ncbi:hypothetical protein THAOC_07944, partial [Thalassiosira oceanica]